MFAHRRLKRGARKADLGVVRWLASLLVSMVALPGWAAMGIVHGDGHVYAVTAPEGWQLDAGAGRKRGLEALLYPVGMTWERSEALFSVDTSPPAQSGQTPEDYIETRLAQLGSQLGETLEVDGASPFRTGDGRRARVRYVRGEVLGRALFAFVFEANAVVSFGLTARSAIAYKTARDAFRSLVESYEFLGSSLGQIESVPHLTRIADSNVASAEGRAYDGAVRQHLVARHAETMKRCIAQRTAPIVPFDVLVLVGAESQVRRVVVHPEGEVPLCLRADIARTRFPKPPRADWWVRISMNPSPAPGSIR